MKELTLSASVSSIPEMTAFVDEQLEAVDCPMKHQMQIDVALDEILSNIARYAYPSGSGDMTLSFDFDPTARQITIVFTDAGVPYDPTSQEEPDTTSSAEDRAIGGLGIFLVRKIMDDMAYERRGNKNVLTIRKRI